MSLDERELALEVANAAWEKKAFDVRILHVTEQLQITDYFVICSGRSDRQVVAIAESVDKHLRKFGHKPTNTEGLRWGRWVCMDYGDVVVHVFHDEVRALYALESLWEDAPELELEEPDWVGSDAVAGGNR